MEFAEIAAHWTAKSEGVLPSYKGAMLRGVLGYALRKGHCTKPWETMCTSCERQGVCGYARLYEPVSSMGDGLTEFGMHDPMRSFVVNSLNHRTRFQEGDRWDFSICLFGPAVSQVPDVIAVLCLPTPTGLGFEGLQGLIQIDAVTISSPVQEIPSDGTFRVTVVPALKVGMPNQDGGVRWSVRMDFLSVTSLKNGGKSSTFEVKVLGRALLRRAFGMIALYGSEDQSNWIRTHRHELEASWGSVWVDRDETRWRRWGRTSSRQQRSYEVEGLIGRVQIRNVPEMWLSLLRLCEVLHVGKGATFGLGRFKLSVKREPTIDNHDAFVVGETHAGSS